MLSLNLLSPEEKHASALLWKYLIIKKLILIILSLAIIVGGVLFGAKIMLNQKLTEAKAQNKMININNNKINEKINSYNNRIWAVNLIQKDFIIWSKVLYFFNSIITNGIHLNTLEFDLSQNNFTLNGIAKTRNNLLDFQNAINTCQALNKITLPLNTILKKENISFSISTKFKENLKEIDLDSLTCKTNEN